MSSSSSSTSCFPLPLSSFRLHRPKPNPFFFSYSFKPNSKPTHMCFSSSPDKEEFLWLREEQRWLREEQRWLREEQRWLRERESLLSEIQSLKLRIQSLEGHSVVPLGPVTPPLLEVVKEKGLIVESRESVVGPMFFEENGGRVEEKKVVGVEEKKEEKSPDKAKRKVLRKGSEGEEVRVMQEALQKLGFYSGEEDIEYSSFSSGTERAVKTWQATLGIRDDGIMTAELLERLFVSQHAEGGGSNVDADQRKRTPTVLDKDSDNGATVASITEISELQQRVVKEDGVTEVEVSQQRVFLLGENRWEDPSRVRGREKVAGGSKTKDTTTKCLACRGEGRLLCTECDGTGEPNVEEQFLAWIDEGAKCPYCEGLGYTICDVCDGKAMS